MEANIKAPRRKKAIGRSRSDVIFDTVIFIILTAIFLIVAYPLYFIIISSFSNPTAVAGGDVILWPIGINFDGYIDVFKNQKVVGGFLIQFYILLLELA